MGHNEAGNMSGMSHCPIVGGVLCFLLMGGSCKSYYAHPAEIDLCRESDKVIIDTSVVKIYSCSDVDIPPEFPGGIDAMHNYMNSKLIWPEEQGCAIGSVWISVIIDSLGQVRNPVITRSHLPECFEREAMRVVKSFPKFAPGSKAGKNVNVRLNIPVRFQTQY